MPAQERQRPSSLTLLLLGSFLVLILALWKAQHGEDSRSSRGGLLSLSGDGILSLDDVDRLERKMDKPTEARDGKHNGSRLGGFAHARVRRKPGLEGDDLYPKTQDFQTSGALELAQGQVPGTLIGWVSDDRALALAGAKVHLEYEKPSPDDASKPPVLESTSTEIGLFRIEGIPPGHWTVVAEKESFAKAAQAGLEILPGVTHDPVELRLAPEIVLKGKVNGSGAPLAGATVAAVKEILSVRGADVQRIRLPYGDSKTSAEGAFEIRQLPPGHLILIATAPGYARLEKELEITAGMAEVTLTMEAGESIAGFVRDELQQAVPGAELTLQTLENPDKNPKPATKSEPNGAFLFGHLPAKTTYNLIAKAPGYAQTGPLPIQTGTMQNIIVLATGGAVEGRVTNFETGAAMGGIGVLAKSAEEGKTISLWSRTLSDGRYRITQLPAGAYDVTIISDRFTSAPRLGVKVEPDKIAKDVDFSIYPGLTIEGTVVDGDSKEQLPNATVTLSTKVGQRLLLMKDTKATTDESGQFLFKNLPQGVYTLQAELKGYMAGVREEAYARVELNRGSIADPVEIKLYRGGVIEGLVVDANGEPVPSALIQIFHAPGTPSHIANKNFKATTSVAGSYSLEGIPIHDEVHLYVSATAEGRPKGRSEKVVLNQRQSVKNAPIVLPVPGWLEVVVSGPGDSGIAEANVSISHADFPGDDAPAAWSAKSGVDGVVGFGWLPPGSISVSASKEGYLPASAGTTIKAGEGAKLTLKLDAARLLAGSVEDDRNVPIREGSVRASPEPGARGSGSSPIDANGDFAISTLGSGTFTVQVNAIRQTPTGTHTVEWAFSKIAPTEQGGDVVFPIPFNGTLEGHVYEPDTGAAPARYTVSLEGTYKDSAGIARTFRSAHTFEAQETFRFESIPPASYHVTASAPNCLPATVGPIVVQSPGIFSAGTLRLKAGGTLKLQLVDSFSQESVVGATVTLVPDGPSGKTDGNGNVVITPINPGMYTVQLRHDQYLPRDLPLVKVTRAKEDNLGTVEMDPGGVLYGTVVDGQGDPLRSISIEARSVDRGTLKRASTDAGGRYTMLGLEPGGHIVTFSGKVDNRSVSRSIDAVVSANKETLLDMVLRADARLIGGLAAAADTNVSRSVVRVYPLRADNTPVLGEVVNVQDITGNRFEVENLAEGPYLIVAQAPRTGGGLAYWYTVANVAYPATRALVAQGAFVLRGRLVASRSGPAVAKQEVRLDLLTAPHSGVSDLRRWWQWSIITDDEGRFAFDGLPQGTYSVVAHSESLRSDILEFITIAGPDLVVEYDFDFSQGTPSGGGQKSLMLKMGGGG